MIKYPSAINDELSLPRFTRQTPLSPDVFNRLRDAIVAIETELGVVPKSTYGSVRARLDALEYGLRNSISISGDIGGTSSSLKVIGINGNLIDNIPAQHHHSLIFNGYSQTWFPGFVNVDDLIPPYTIRFVADGYSLSEDGYLLLELGQELNQPSFVAEYTATPYQAYLADDQGNDSQNITSTPNNFSSDYFFVKNVFGQTVVFTVTSSSVNNPVLLKTKEIAFAWGQNLYWGVSTEPVSYDQSFVTGLANNQLSLSKNKTFTVNSGVGEYIYFCCRADFDEPLFLVNDSEGGFSNVATVSITNGFGVTEDYSVYRSDNPNLGETYVIVS